MYLTLPYRLLFEKNPLLIHAALLGRARRWCALLVYSFWFVGFSHRDGFGSEAVGMHWHVRVVVCGGLIGMWVM